MTGRPARPVIPLQVLSASPSQVEAPRHLAPVPLALYVHFPWCRQKCPYCDFNSHAWPTRSGAAGAPALPEEDYVAALLADLEQAVPLIWGRRVGSIFFGGGTPSLLSAAAVDTLLGGLRSRLSVLPNAEITLEANPESVDAANFAAYRAAGVNRLSLGIQSFADGHLLALGRIHNGKQARWAIETAARHFDNFNLDLMYGLPGQTLDQAIADLRTALAYAPPHLSCYQLTIEPNTAFAARPPALPDADACADMQDAIEGELAAAAYVHYETAAFARSGYECRHNLNYWHFGDYLGIGAGAHSKLTLPERVLRQMRWKQPQTYLAQVAVGQPVQEEHRISPGDLPVEFMMNALRLLGGFEAPLFAARTGQSLAQIEAALQQAERTGLLERSGQRIAPTDRGRRFLNRLLAGFLPKSP
ncbi:MAG: radical SAM family heme chaperone HemW [Candidatus Accumulibacter sp.]|mgnify:CR=1 FL=1|uniref:radical SAM family heme chaperone HemW n=1 Tax=Accumulibacter sp. TaxID=2053492 RepID=UPI00287AF7A9|nr:radical SAM family heme chaperone HemW [Accumulibacter sp.]MDS4016449.1 radical SAM family heme chaperone HemW [Accumulibacter sp.]